MTRSVPAFLLFLWILAGAAGVTAQETGPQVGQSAPDFRVQDLSGNPVSLQELRSQGHVLVLFWSTQCPVCHSMLPEFKRVHEQYDGKGLRFVALNIGYEDQTAVEAYAFEHDLNYLILNDDEQKFQLVQDWRLVGTPTIQLIAPDGEVLFRGHRLPPLDLWLGDPGA